MLKRTLLVALIAGLTVVGIAKPAKKTRKASAKSQISSKARSGKLTVRNGKKVRKKVVPYRVKPGDNDWTIAKKTGVSVRELRHINGGKKLGLIRAGQTLNIAKFVAARKKSAPKKIAAAPKRRKTVVASAPRRSSRKAYVAYAAKRRAAAPKRVYAPKPKTTFAPKAVTIVVANPAPVEAAPAKMPTTVIANPVRSAPTKGSVEGILQKANTFRGVRYSYGAMSRSATDCSGFTSQVFRANGYRIPRTSAAQSKVGQKVSRGDLAPGDLVFFRTVRGTRVSHVGIYVGGNRFIHASSGGHKVMVSSLTGYYSNRYVGARRLAKGGAIKKVVQTAVEAEKTQTVPVPLDPEPRQSASDVIGN